MAWYKYSQLLGYLGEGEFDKVYPAGSTAPWSGIYRCEVCGREAVHTVDRHLPPQNHHAHPLGQGPIRWRLVVTDAAS